MAFFLDLRGAMVLGVHQLPAHVVGSDLLQSLQDVQEGLGVGRAKPINVLQDEAQWGVFTDPADDVEDHCSSRVLETIAPASQAERLAREPPDQHVHLLAFHRRVDELLAHGVLDNHLRMVVGGEQVPQLVVDLAAEHQGVRFAQVGESPGLSPKSEQTLHT